MMESMEWKAVCFNTFNCFTISFEPRSKRQRHGARNSEDRDVPLVAGAAVCLSGAIMAPAKVRVQTTITAVMTSTIRQLNSSISILENPTNLTDGSEFGANHSNSVCCQVAHGRLLDSFSVTGQAFGLTV